MGVIRRTGRLPALSRGGLALLIALAPLTVALAEPANSTGASPELATLQETESRVQSLIATLDAAIATMEAAIVDYLERADAASSHADRQTMENLAATANRQLGELQAQRATLRELHAELRTHLDAMDDASATR